MNYINQPLLCQCINTKIGHISTKGGIKPVFLIELVSDTGEIFVKFLNVNMTAKGNYTVDRNSAFAKLYRLTRGNNPQKKFSCCNQLLKHFVGYRFFIKYEKAFDKREGDYLRVTDIKPEFSIAGDTWAITGHLIKNVRQIAREKQVKIGGLFGDKQGTNRGQTRESNLTSRHTGIDVERDLHPIQHPPSKIGTSHIPIDNRIEGKDKSLIHEPDNPFTESHAVNKQNFLH